MTSSGWIWQLPSFYVAYTGMPKFYNEFKMCKLKSNIKLVAAYFKILTQYLLAGNEENHEGPRSKEAAFETRVRTKDPRNARQDCKPLHSIVRCSHPTRTTWGYILEIQSPDYSLSSIKYFRATSRVKMEICSNVSESLTASIIREWCNVCPLCFTYIAYIM
jgi:hypothetical protein